MTEKNTLDIIKDFLSDKEVYELQRILNEHIAGVEKLDSALMYASDIITKSHRDLFAWFKTLPLFYETEKQIFAITHRFMMCYGMARIIFMLMGLIRMQIMFGMMIE